MQIKNISVKTACIICMETRKNFSCVHFDLDFFQIKSVKEYREPAILTLNLENVTALPEKAQQALELFGSVDILINNAGVSYRGRIQDTAVEVDQKLLTVNYLGHVAFIKGAYLMFFEICVWCI